VWLEGSSRPAEKWEYRPAAANDMAGVVLENLVKEFDGGVRVVDGLSLEVADREFVVLVGPSGCGKSTTLRMIAGLEAVTSGTISIGSKRVNDLAPRDRDVAMVFQSYALYPHMTVFENMAFSLKLRNVAKKTIDEQVRRAAQILGIGALLERKPKALSGGQRQRVAVGRAIVRDPQCFLFDEPLSNLDAKLRVEMRAELKQLHSSLNATTLYVTHDQEEAMTLGDRLVVLKDGILQQAASALEIYERPKNRFVAGFLGSPPMNFFEGALVREGADLHFDEGSGRLTVPAWASAALSPHVGSRVVLGMRPDAMAVEAHARFETRGKALPMRVTLIQLLGGRMDVHVATPAHPRAVTQMLAHGGLRPGDELRIFFDPERMHFFEPDAVGKSIATNPRALGYTADRFDRS
jgi:multiple sugar transport system ATP-binding protein